MRSEGGEGKMKKEGKRKGRIERKKRDDYFRNGVTRF